MARQGDIKILIHNYSRRLQKLKERKALMGLSVDPATLLEIEDIETEIRDLQIELAVIERRIGLPAALSITPPRDNDDHRTKTGPPCILVADDEPDFLENICLSLEVAGYDTITAQNGLEALNIMQERTIDLILSDISMPYMSGYQLYQRMCDHPHWITIPFIFLTCRSLDTDIYYGKELGVDDYLTKPIRPEHLLSVVRGKLQRHTAINRTFLEERSIH